MLEAATLIGILIVAGFYQCRTYGIMTMMEMLSMFIFIVPMFMIKKPKLNFLFWLIIVLMQNWIRIFLYTSLNIATNEDFVVSLGMDVFKQMSGQVSLTLFAVYLIGLQVVLINRQISMLNKATNLEQIDLQSRSDDMTFITFSTLAFIVYNAFCLHYYSLDVSDFKSFFDSIIISICSILVLKFVYNNSYKKRVGELLKDVPKTVMVHQDTPINVEDLSDGD